MFWRTRGRPLPDLELEEKPAPKAAGPSAGPGGWSAWARSVFNMGPLRRLQAVVFLALVGAFAASLTTWINFQVGLLLGAVAGGFLPELIGFFGFVVKVALALFILGLGLYWYALNYTDLPVWLGG